MKTIDEREMQKTTKEKKTKTKRSKGNRSYCERVRAKVHLLYLANSYFYNYKPSPCILGQHRVLQNFRKDKNIVITKPDIRNGVVILD